MEYKKVFVRMALVIGVVVLIALVAACFCFGVANAAPFPDGWVIVDEHSIVVSYDSCASWQYITFDGVMVTPPLLDIFIRSDLDPNSTHHVCMSCAVPPWAYYDYINTLPLPLDYSPLFILILVFLVCLYLSIRAWVFLAPAAMLSLSIVFFVREVGYLWYFEVLGAFCFVCTAVVGALLLSNTRK